MTHKLVLLALTAALGAIGFLAAGSLAGGATATTGTVSLRTTKLGPVLVNRAGHTLYLFMKDRNGKSACSGSCPQFWPPLIAHGKPTAGTGVKAALLGTTKRPNGSLQVTYNRHPLYAYSVDKGAGQVNGEAVSAFGAKWYALSARGTAVIKAAPPPPPTSTGYTNTGYTNTGYGSG